MSAADFLHKDASTQLSELYMTAGAVFSFSTNYEDLLKAARGSFLPVKSPIASVDFSLRFWVDLADQSQRSWPKPYIRGLDHLVFAGFDVGSSMLADLRTRRVIGRFSAGIAADSTYWRTVIFPMLVSIVAGSVGVVELHASSVATGQQGLILLGPSHSGKSTLAMALTKAGFKFLSDDRTFCSVKHKKLAAWGLPRPLKLRRDSGSFFDDFRDREPSAVQNGERVFHFDPGPHRIVQCEPRMLVVLQRECNPGFAMTPLANGYVRSQIEQDLLAESPDAVRRQEETLNHLLSVPCFMLRYGGKPQQVAEQLAASFSNKTLCQWPGTM